VVTLSSEVRAAVAALIWQSGLCFISHFHKISKTNHSSPRKGGGGRGARMGYTYTSKGSKQLSDEPIIKTII